MQTLFDMTGGFTHDRSPEPKTLTTDVKSRPYQREAYRAIMDKIEAGERSTALILPTGTGKTFTAAMVIKALAERGKRTLVLAHRGELIEQFAEALVRVGLEVGIEKAEQYARALTDPQAVVATVQTMQGRRLATWPSDYFELIVTDEAHHATASTYKNTRARFPNAFHLGITATPDRSDEEFLGDVFDSIAYELSLWDAMRAPEPGPYLCRLRFVQCDVGIDLRSIRTTGGDLNQADLEEAITPLIETLANAIRQESGDRPTLIFTPDVGSATAFATALRAMGLEADWASGDRPERGEVVKAYKRGDIQFLANCNLFTEGFDAPRTAAVALCRPTKSRPLYAQMVGRGTRLFPGKEDCLLIDFNWLTEKLKLVKPAELFDTTHTDSEVLDVAQELLVAEPGLELTEAIERAEKEHQRRREIRVAAKQREVKYRKVSYDPISFMEALAIPVRREAESQAGTATDRQRAALKKFGVVDVDGLSRRRAGMLLDAAIGRAKEGLATMKQVSWLIRTGVPAAEARALTFEEASERLSQAFARK